MAQDDDGEWERPIGLTAEYAISLCDSTDDDGDDANEPGGCAAAASSGDDIRSSGQSNVVVAKDEGRVSSSMCDDDDRSTDNRALRLDKKEITDVHCAVVLPNEERPSSLAGGGRNGVAVDDDNPFVSFAFRSGEASTSTSTSTWRRTTTTTLLSTQSRPQTVAKCGGAAIIARRKTAAAKDQEGNENKKRRIGGGTRPLFTRGTAGTHDEDVSGFDGISPHRSERDGERIDERRKLVERWHAYADPNAPIEQRRFQILIAARLHARCQSPIVTGAMCKLRRYFDEKRDEFGGQGLTATTLSNADPETDIAPLLSSVLFGNEKARQIVRAAHDVLSKFGGRVPETTCGLREITGIGPKLTEILMIVNRRCAFN
jgi:hypothetical protein